MSKSKKITNTEPHSLHAKELQKFFNKVTGVMLIPGDKKFQGFNFPVLSLLFDEKNYANFKDYQIHNNIIELLDDKYPILSIRVNENAPMAGLSIIDQDSGLRFQLPDQGVSEPLLKFIKSTIPMSKIVIIAGYFKDGQVLFDKDVKQQPLLILDGFIFE